MSDIDALRRRARKNYARSLKAHAATAKRAEGAKKTQEKAHLKGVRDRAAIARSHSKEGQRLYKAMEKHIAQKYGR